MTYYFIFAHLRDGQRKSKSVPAVPAASRPAGKSRFWGGSQGIGVKRCPRRANALVEVKVPGVEVRIPGCIPKDLLHNVVPNGGSGVNSPGFPTQT